MENEKNVNFGEDDAEHEGESMESAPRARNRTVMLTPEITGQVRARLAQELEAHPKGGQPTRGLPQPSSGFVPLAQRRASSENAGQVQDGGDAGGFQRGFNEARYSQPSSRGRAVPPAAGEEPPARPVRQTQQPYQPQNSEGDRIEWRRRSKLVGFLVSFDRDSNGDSFELRSGRLIVTSEVPSGGNFMFIDDQTVSPMHAVVRVTEQGEIQVLDQLSEHGTKVTHFGVTDEVELSGDKCSLGHGDLIRFGERRFCVCVLPKPETE